MDESNPAKVKRFWSVLIKKIEITSEADLSIVARVTGWFVYVILRAGSSGREIKFYYLTDMDNPFVFNIPPWFWEKKTVDRITAKDVVNQFIRLMKVPIEVIPPKPLDIPWEKLPPSKRKEIIEKLLRQRESEMKVKEPNDIPEETDR